MNYPEILILSGEYDFSTDLVCDQLRKRSVPFLRLNREHFGIAGWKVALDPVAAVLQVNGFGDTWIIENSRLRSIWFRQPVFLRNAIQNLTAQEQFERSQWMAFIRGLSVFETALWVNHPRSTYLAESKPYQLRRAAEAGFQIPQTVVTNDFMAISGAGISEPFILKAVDTVLMSEADTNIFPYSTIFEMNDIADDAFATAPTICQTLLRPKVDIRVTVVGDFVHSVRIVESGIGIDGDWRLRPREMIKFEPYTLSKTISDHCVALVRDLDLRFAAIDLAETPDGLWFIEVNPTGEWGWLNGDQRVLENALCSLLCDDEQN